MEYVKNKIKKIKLHELNNKKLLPNKIGIEASIISKNKKIRRLVDIIQKKYAYNPPKKYNGSCLDGRDITYKILPDADFKFFITADIKIHIFKVMSLEEGSSCSSLSKNLKFMFSKQHIRKISFKT